MTVQNIIVAGKSGAGKQPRIDVLLAEYGLKQLSTGNIFREYLGAYGKVRELIKTDHLWRDGVFASDRDISAVIEPAAKISERQGRIGHFGFQSCAICGPGRIRAR